MSRMNRGASGAGAGDVRHLGRLIVIQLIIAIVAAVGTALFAVNVGVGIVAGLVAFVISLQIQMLMATASTDFAAQVTIQELAPIVALKQVDPGTADFIKDLARAQGRYLQAPRRDVIFDLELNHQRTALLELYDECSRGQMRLNLRASSMLRETDGVASVSRELKATSVVPVIAYWDSPGGHDYLDQQEGLLERGVVIRRVFIESEATLSDLRNVVDRHLGWRRKFGADKVDVRIALLEGLPSDLIEDYAIVDGETVIRLEIQRAVNQPSAVVWETSSVALERAQRAFDRLWRSAVEPTKLPVFVSSNGLS